MKPEEIEKELNEIADEYERTAGLYPQIVEVIKEFDGKCYNKRFVEALKEKTGEWVHLAKWEYSDDLYLNGTNGHNTLFSIKKANDGSRTKINAEECIASATENRDRFMQLSKTTKEAIVNGPVVAKQIEELTNKMNELVGTIPYNLKGYFNIPYTIHI